jgi:hypothetical protein
MPKYKIDYVKVYSYMFDTYDWGKLEIPYHAYSLIPNASAEDIFPDQHAEYVAREDDQDDPCGGSSWNFYLEKIEHYPEDHDTALIASSIVVGKKRVLV